jgi:hypothetical protein
MTATNVIFSIVRIVVAGMLFWALGRHPIGYYTVLRLATCGVCAFGIYVALKVKQVGWIFVFATILLLFQPFVSLRITRQTWQYVDVSVGIILLISIPYLWIASQRNRLNEADFPRGPSH